MPLLVVKIMVQTCFLKISQIKLYVVLLCCIFHRKIIYGLKIIVFQTITWHFYKKKEKEKILQQLKKALQFKSYVVEVDKPNPEDENLKTVAILHVVTVFVI